MVQLTYIIMRIIISGRAPITNMYETVLFSGFASLVLTMFLKPLQKRANVCKDWSRSQPPLYIYA